ncbi:MAG: ABC transporter ATP-binding protein [bacterium]
MKVDSALTAVSMRGIRKSFSQVLANSDVDFEVKVGEIHALLGENGAGKTTLMKILSGLYRPDEGEILVYGRRVHLRSPKDAMDLGIGMVHQHFELVPNFTVAQNILLGASRDLLSEKASREREIRELSERYGLEVDPQAQVWQLSVGEQQRVEILKMLYRKVRILILDEPTAALTAQEIEKLFSTLRRIAREGCSVIFITHKLEEVLEIADHITVLRRGKVMASISPSQIKHKGQAARMELARMMVGREVILRVEREPVDLGDVVLEVEGLRVFDDRGREAVRGVSFSVRRGEVLGIIGVAGNGQREMVEAIVGLRPIAGGRVLVKGGDVGYIPEDRLGRGSAPNLNLAENIILTCYKDFSGRWFLNLPSIRRRAKELALDFKIVAPSSNALARQLSGGNLQRLILARELSREPRLLIAEQPTHGLDVASTEDVWKALLGRRRTAGILLVSGDLREVLSLSDRIGVMFRGEIVDIISVRDEPSRVEEIGLMMTGLKGGGDAPRN